MALPNAYTQLKYIQATGTQYINTGVTATANTTAKYKFSLDGIKTYGPHILSGANWFFPLLRSLSGSTFVAHRGGNNVENTTFTGKVGVDYEVDAFTNNKVTINGVDCGTITNGSSSSDTTTLYLMTYAGSPSDSNYTMSGKLYYCQIYENGTLIRDFIPAMRTSDSAVGLYDQANGVFYTNAGSGSFTGFLATGKVEGTGASIIDGASYGMEQGKTLVNGTAYDINVGKTLIGGTAYEISFVSGIPLSSFAEGSIVYVNERGAPAAFYVAKHNYESGLNGAGRTLLVRKVNFGNLAWRSSGGNAFSGSTIDTWLNNNYKGILDAATQEAIGTTKFYYTPGNGNTTVTTLSRAVFLLSGAELGFTPSYATVEGSTLPTNSLLKSVTAWLRTPLKRKTNQALYQIETGTFGTYGITSKLGVRPVFTLPSNATFDEETSVFNGGMA